jgi:hypothetical protein
MSPKDAYLIFYNVLCCVGWALVCKTALQSILSDLGASIGLLDALAEVYYAPNLANLLWYSQLAALLEIVHALLRLVRSPVMVTAMQVGSRIVALVAIAYAPSAQGKTLFVQSDNESETFINCISHFAISSSR